MRWGLSHKGGGSAVWLLATTLLLTACGPGRASRATVDPSRPPPAPETPPRASETEPEAEAADSAGADTVGVPAPIAPGYPAAIQIGARVAELRVEPVAIVVEVGDSLALGEDLEMIAYDASGQVVHGIPILPNLDSRFAALEDGYVKGVAEGEAELRMAIRVPPAAGTGPPEIRTFSAPLRVVGPPVVAVEVVDPGVRFLAGAVIRLEARALTAEGGREGVGRGDLDERPAAPGHR